MTAMFQGHGDYHEVVGKRLKGMLPESFSRIEALKQGSEGAVKSDLQVMLENERKQHEDNYRYEQGNNSGGNLPLGKASF